MVVPVGSAPASILGSVPHAPPCLRLRAGERRTRYQGNSGLAWPSIDTVHRALYRTVTHTVQRFLALIPIPMREAEFSSPRLPLACVSPHNKSEMTPRARFAAEAPSTGIRQFSSEFSRACGFFGGSGTRFPVC